MKISRKYRFSKISQNIKMVSTPREVPDPDSIAYGALLRCVMIYAHGPGLDTCIFFCHFRFSEIFQDFLDFRGKSGNFQGKYWKNKGICG